MRPIKVTISPLANSSPNNIATSQTPASGTATVTITAGNANLAATNSFFAGQVVTFNGNALPAGMYPSTPYYVLATALSGSNFQVSGNFGGTAVVPGAGQSGTQTVVYTNNPGLNGTLVNNQGVAVLDTARRVLITTNDTTTTFTITGTDRTGNNMSESFIVSGGSTYSALDYSTVTSVTANQGPTAALTIGTNGVASSAWVAFDEWANNGVMVQIDVSGNANYTLQTTTDNPNSTGSDPAEAPSALIWVNSNDLTVVNATTTQQTNIWFTPIFARVLLNSGNGTVTGKFIQNNVVNY